MAPGQFGGRRPWTPARSGPISLPPPMVWQMPQLVVKSCSPVSAAQVLLGCPGNKASVNIAAAVYSLLVNIVRIILIYLSVLRIKPASVAVTFTIINSRFHFLRNGWAVYIYREIRYLRESMTLRSAARSVSDVYARKTLRTEPAIRTPLLHRLCRRQNKATKFGIG